jgi:hypothetical protein
MNIFIILKATLMLLEIVACITAFVTIPRNTGSFWKWMPFFLLLVVVGELVGHYLAYVPKLREYNPILFNYFLYPVQIIFTSWLIFKNTALYHPKRARWILYAIAVYIICWVIDFIVIPDPSSEAYTSSNSVGATVILFALALFYFYYINSEDIIVFKRARIFWVSAGIFLYYIATLPFEGLRNILLEQPKVFLIWWYIYMGLACTMYLLFIIGFICAKKK